MSVNEVSILAYDALGLIYYCWSSNNKEFKTAQLHNKEGFKGLHAEFYIDENLSKQKLKIYKILNKDYHLALVSIQQAYLKMDYYFFFLLRFVNIKLIRF